eukprot:TRINITY_DN3205_c0_g1_i12.p1 TRINITY_DN3205_c0_g1~~TRINITY_DN3205_c0_g1_i12.p1  ORF type:complete len:382 (+),score=59.18 TRINITY_DN3205_c0_g1_i12:765-1910(+)
MRSISASLTMIYGCRGVHPRIVLLISLSISTGLLIAPLLSNLPLNHELTGGKIIEIRFGTLCPEVKSKLPTVAFNPGLYMFPGDFRTSGWGLDPTPRYTTHVYKDISDQLTNYTDGNYPPGFSGEGVRPWSSKLLLDVYLPKNTSRLKSAIIFFVHGGGWRLGDKDLIRFSIDYWLSKGYAFVSPQYRLLAHGYNVSDMLEDISDAFYWIQHNSLLFPTLNMKCWIFMGEDSGGYLATTTAYLLHEPRIKGVVNFYGLTELDLYVREGYDKKEKFIYYLLGGDVSLAQNFSSSNFITNQTPSTLTLHGHSDSIVPESISHHLHKVLKFHGIHELELVFQSYDHGLVGSFYAHANQLCFYAIEHYIATLTQDANCSVSLINN